MFRKKSESTVILIYLTILSLSLSVIISGCGKKETAGKSSKQTLLIATGKDDYSCSWGGKATLCSEGLLLLDSNLEFRPLLAESWEISEDGKIYTFHLRKGIRFHDCAPFDSKAVKYAFETYHDSFVKSDGIKSVETPDDYTVRFILKEQNPIFLSGMAVYREILSPSAVKQALEKGIQTDLITQRVFVGTGPFKFKEWVKDEKIVFEKNVDYWNGKVKLDEVIFKIIPDAQTRVSAFEAEYVHLIGNDPFSVIPLPEIPRLRKNPNIEIFNSPSFTTYGITWFSFNTEKELFKDIRIRKAISCAVDVESIKETVFGQEEVLITKGPISPLSKFANPNLKRHEYEPEIAKKLLAETGWKDTDGDGIVEKNGKPFKVIFPIGNRIPEWRTIAQILQAQLREVGIDVAIETYEDVALREMWKKGRYDLIAQTSIGSPHDDPQMHFESYYSTQERFKYPPVIKDEKLDELISSLKTVTGNERIEVYRKIQQRIEELIPGVYIYHEPMFTAVSKKVKNFTICSPLPWHRYQVLKDIYIGDKN